MKLRLLSSLILSSSLLVACGEDATENTASAKKSVVAEPKTIAEAEPKMVKHDDHDHADNASHEHHDKKIEVAASAPTKASSDDSGTVHTVEMRNAGVDGIMVFVPGFIKINKGDTVNFVASDAGHNAVSEVSSGASWQVGFSGGKVKFDKEGVNIYYCVPHRSMGMYGVVQVGEATNKADAVSKANTIDAGFAMNSGRLNKYIAQIN